MALGTLGTTKTFTIAGRTFTEEEITNAKFYTLCAPVITSGRRSTFRRSGVGSGYAPSGTTFSADVFRMNSSASNFDFLFGYGDNDVGYDSTTAITNPVYFNGNSTINVANNLGGGQQFWDFFLNRFTLPSGKFLFMQSSSGTGYSFIYGTEA